MLFMEGGELVEKLDPLDGLQRRLNARAAFDGGDLCV